MYKSRTRPFAHQIAAAQASEGRHGFAFLMEMGTGKTKVMIDEMGELHTQREIACAVVLCPKGVVATWVRELETHMGTEYRVVRWNSSPNKKQAAELTAALQPSPELRVLVMNIEALSAGKKAEDYLSRYIDSGWCYVAIDESQTIKGPSSKRTKKILSLSRRIRYRRIATGTPAPNSPMDIYSQMEFITPGSTGQRSFFGFRSRYAVLQEKMFGGRRVKVEVAYRNLEELQERLGSVSFRVRKDECLDLPKKLYTTRSVELTDEQARAYAGMRDEALAMIGTTFASSQPAITTLMRLQQIVCGFVTDEEGDTVYIDSNRVQAVLDIAEQTDEDIIVWTGHRPAVRLVGRCTSAAFR
jgi:SNF2 family DNA or RNA helicase